MIELLAQLEDHANFKYDGHYTIFRFTTNYKVFFGTITEIEDIENIIGYPTLKSAIVNCLLNEGL